MSVERVGESVRYVRLSTVCLIVACCLSGCSSDVQEQGEWQVRDRVDGAREEIDVSVTPNPEDGGAPEVAPSCEGAPDHDVDSDFDGLSDCEERLRGCVDPHTLDTDGDGLGDGEEDELGSDPCSLDSDGDGVDDLKEIVHGLDPNDPTTYGDTPDADLFIVRACDTIAPAPTTLYEDREGDWAIALPPGVEYTKVTRSDAEKKVSAAVFSDPSLEVSGFMLSEPLDGRLTASDKLVGYRPHLGAVGMIYQDFTEGEFDTHDGHKAAPGEYSIRTWDVAVGELRDRLFGALTSRAPEEIAGLPTPSGELYDDYYVRVTVIERDDRFVTLLTVMPMQRESYPSTARALVDDLTNTTGVVTASDSAVREAGCYLYPISNTLPFSPISSSLRVEASPLDDLTTGYEVPRSREDGFGYFPQTNAIALYGRWSRSSTYDICDRDADCTAQYETCWSGVCHIMAPDQIAVHFERFVRWQPVDP